MEWTTWNPGKPPATGTVIVALIQNYNSILKWSYL